MNPLDLSRGELKRLVLACVLAKDHDLLILDEPFSSLDCTEKERLCGVLSGRKKGITVIFTHEQAHFPRVDRIWEIQGGVLHDRGRLPSALGQWDHAPVIVKDLMARGRVPENISQADLLEAACRI
jgi:energy-coupling factor transport system ATP-binding protein